MELTSYQEIIQFAIQGEIEAQRFYSDIAAKVTDPSLKEMFLAFAGEEKKHENLLMSIKANESAAGYFSENRDYGVSETVDPPEIRDGMTLADAFAVAMKNEEKAMKMYQSLADDCTSETLGATFRDLAAMERDHKFKMEAAFTEVAFPEKW